MSNTYLRGQGSLFIAPRNSAGQIGGFVAIGDAEALTIKQSETYDTVNESESGARVKVVHTATEYNMDFEMTVLNFSKANFAKAVLGTSATVAAGNVTGESHKAWKGSSIFLKYPNVSSVVIGALVAGTDYIVATGEGDSVAGKGGRIDFPTGSSITDGATITVNYAHGGAEGVIEAATNTANREYIIIFQGKNMNTSGTPVIARMHRAYLNVSQDLSLINEKTARFTMGGSLLPAQEITDGTSKFLSLTVADFA